MNIDKQKWQQLWQEVVEKKKLDPVGKADADIDNDGDVDNSDEYLHNRRKAIKKSMKEQEGTTPCPQCEGSTENHDPECPRYEAAEKSKMNKKEASDLDTKNATQVLKHDCASHITHEQWGYGECIKGEHTLVESADGEGYVTHYDIMFEHGVEFDVPVEDLTIIKESSHGHMKRKKKESKQEDKPEVKEEAKCEKCDCDPCDCVIAEGTVTELDQQIQDAYRDIQAAAIESMKRMFEKSYDEKPKIKSDRSQHAGDAPPPETQKDMRSGKGADKMAKDLDADSPDADDKEEQGHDDVSKAGRAVAKQSPTRGGEKRTGDLKPQIPKDTTKV